MFRYKITFILLIISLFGVGGAQESDVYSAAYLAEKFNSFSGKKEWMLHDGPEIYQGTDLEEIEKDLSDMIIDYGTSCGLRGSYFYKKNDMILQVILFVFPSQIQAFGLYSVEKSPSLEFHDLGFQAYTAGHKITTWYGKFVLFAESPDTTGERDKLLREFSEEFINQLPKQKQSTPLLDCLPEKNRVNHSRKFYMRHWLAQNFFHNIYYADYYTAEGYCRMFIIDNKKTATADSNFWNYFGFMRENAEVFQDTLKIATDYVVVGEPLWGRTILAKKNQIIYGILDYRNSKWAEDRLHELLESLKKRKIVKPG